MPLPVLLTLGYLAVNLSLLTWLEHARATGQPVSPRLVTISNVMRWGPPILGAVYLVLISGDWAFVAFVIAFFAIGFWLLDGLLAYENRGPGGPDAPPGER